MGRIPIASFDQPVRIRSMPGSSTLCRRGSPLCLSHYSDGRAGAAFVGVSSGLLAFGLARTRAGLAKLPLFVSAPFCMAALLAQWAPLMMAGAVIPSLQFLGAAKPNVAIPCFAYRPTLRGVLLGVAFVAVSLVVIPTWPFDWRDALREAPRYRAPITYVGGPILLLAALRWRRAEARVLLAMSFMPQLTLFYDQLPLWLVPSTVWRSLALSALSWVAWAQWYPNRALPTHVAIARPWVFALIYVQPFCSCSRPSGLVSTPKRFIVTRMRRRSERRPFDCQLRPTSSPRSQRGSRAPTCTHAGVANVRRPQDDDRRGQVHAWCKNRLNRSRIAGVVRRRREHDDDRRPRAGASTDGCATSWGPAIGTGGRSGAAGGQRHGRERASLERSQRNNRVGPPRQNWPSRNRAIR